MHKHSRRGLAVALGTVGLAAIAAAAAVAGPAGTSRGPSTTTDPYVLPVASSVAIKSLLTVGDRGAQANGYEMVGIPDGLGASSGSFGRDFTLYMNHELVATAGAVRAHGQKGAFVSAWEIDPASFAVENGWDLVQPGVSFWDYVTQTYGNTPSKGGPNPRTPGDTFPAQLAAFGRFCSSSLTEPGELFNRRTGNGYRGQLYFGNEEIGDEGRAFGITEDGKAQQLPRLGLFSWEQTIAASNRSDTTLVLGLEDTADGQMWVYAGDKTRSGNAFERAGLTNGTDFVLDMVNESVSTDAGFRTTFGKGVEARWDLAEVPWDLSGAAQNGIARAVGLTLNRIEDGAWDPRHPNDFYFVTTEGGKGADVPTGRTGRDGGGVWRMRFDDIEQPELGGSLTLLLDGSEAPFLNKPDNVGMDRHGNFLIQEDAGNNVHLGRIVAYDVDTGKRGVVGQFDAALFSPATPGGTDAKLTIDEESSGIIDAQHVLGTGWWLFDAQIHRAHPNPTLVEYGQLLALKVYDWNAVYTID